MENFKSIDDLTEFIRTLHYFWSLEIEISKNEAIVSIKYLMVNSGMQRYIGRDKDTVTAANKAWKEFCSKVPDYE